MTDQLNPSQQEGDEVDSPAPPAATTNAITIMPSRRSNEYNTKTTLDTPVLQSLSIAEPIAEPKYQPILNFGRLVSFTLLTFITSRSDSELLTHAAQKLGIPYERAERIVHFLHRIKRRPAGGNGRDGTSPCPHIQRQSVSFFRDENHIEDDRDGGDMVGLSSRRRRGRFTRLWRRKETGSSHALDTFNETHVNEDTW